MHEKEQEKLVRLLKQSFPPMNPKLDRDLWPQMQRRLDERSRHSNWIVSMFSVPALSAVPWFDWALLAVLVAVLCAFPNSIPVWLYHF